MKNTDRTKEQHVKEIDLLKAKITELEKSEVRYQRAELKAKESKKRFDLTMKATQVGIFDWNLITDKIYYSPGWKRILGYKENELPNKLSTWETLTFSGDIKKSRQMIDEVINKERNHYELEFRMRHKDGYWVDILSRAEAVFDRRRNVIRLIGTHVDVTERNKVERELAGALEKVDDYDRKRSESLANLSHTIRTSMNGILGFAGLLKTTNLTGKEKKTYIRIIEFSCNRLLNIINDLVDISTTEKTGIEKTATVAGQEDQVKNLKILIAEDDEPSEMFMTIAVKPLSKKVLNVRTGIKAVEACRANPDIDMVLMDVRMPDMDGYEATRQIRQFNQDIVIIAQTAFGLIGDREIAIEAGCNDYISKPINRDLLIELINRHIKGRK